MTENRRGYESVAQLYPRPIAQLYHPSVGQLYPRPIVLIGASGVGRNELKRRLLVMNPDRYATTIPHTSRKPRANEKNGVDYHFVDRDQMENWMRSKLFLEYGEYRGNLYGTMLESVRSLIESGHVPVLNPHPLALARLRNQEFKPFFIFIQPPPFDVLKETRQRHRTFGDPGRVRIFTDNELEQMISTSVQLDKHYGHWWDARLVNENLDMAFDQLTILLDRAEQEPTWVPTAWTVPRSPLSAFDENQ